MSDKRQPKLTEAQKDCLKLVNKQMTSKEIARELGVSHFTVDQRLTAARKKLGARSRKEAARIYAESAGDTIYEQLVYHSPAIEQSKDKAINQIPTDQVEQLVTSESNRESLFGEKHLNQVSEQPGSLFSYLTVPPIGGKRHNLSKQQIIFRSLNIAFYTTTIIAMLLLILVGALRLVE